MPGTDVAGEKMWVPDEFFVAPGGERDAHYETRTSPGDLTPLDGEEVILARFVFSGFVRSAMNRGESE